jgi:hypothetical protein
MGSRSGTFGDHGGEHSAAGAVVLAGEARRGSAICAPDSLTCIGPTCDGSGNVAGAVHSVRGGIGVGSALGRCLSGFMWFWLLRIVLQIFYYDREVRCENQWLDWTYLGVLVVISGAAALRPVA